MNLLNKLTIKNLKLNKKRTIVTIIGIMLSVALITAVATMYSSMIKSLINYETYVKGNFHVAYFNVPMKEIASIKNTREVKDIYLTKDIGYAKLENSKNDYKPYIFVKGFTKEALNNLSVQLLKGRLPENENEILIPTHLKTNGRVEFSINDTIDLDIGTRVSNDGYELNQNNPFTMNEDNSNTSFEKIINTNSKTYKIVGIIARPAANIEPFTAPGYTFITYMNENDIQGNVDVYAKYTKKGSKDYLSLTAKILNVSEDLFAKAYDNHTDNQDVKNKILDELAKVKYQYSINSYLITLENNPLSEDTAGSLGIMVIIVIIIIIVTSVFCIKNSFDISITEKIKQYGMLRSIGATKKQIKNNVFYEATILGIIGIPLGLLLGFMASYILIIVSNFFLKDMFSMDSMKLVLSYSFTAFAIALILGIVTIYFSAMRSAKKAARVSPIESIRNSANIKIKANKLRVPKIVNKIFGVGGEISYKNLKRNKRKYRTTTISIILSVSIFIALSYFIESAFREIEQELNISDYNIYVYNSGVITDDSLIEKLKETTASEYAGNYAIYQSKNIKIKNLKNSKEFMEMYGLFNGGENIQISDYTSLITIGDYQYKKYLKKLNLDYQDYQDKAILINYEIHNYKDKDDNYVEKIIPRYDYSVNDVINLYDDDDDNNSYDIEVGYITSEVPFAYDKGLSSLIVSDATFNKINKGKFYNVFVYYDSPNANKLQDQIDSILTGENYNLNNKDENVKIMKNFYTLIAIFLYGFIIVISLIGITNIFNTITTNMELRKQEFAMLKSIGMTKWEFNNMIRLESIFMGFKSLIIGIPIGVGLSYLMYISLNLDYTAFTPSYLAIVISIIVVYLLITILMKYSLNKISKQNTIETIRNENI